MKLAHSMRSGLHALLEHFLKGSLKVQTLDGTKTMILLVISSVLGGASEILSAKQ